MLPPDAETALADRYRSMDDEAALRLAAEPDALTADAQRILAAELRARGRMAEADDVSGWVPHVTEPRPRLPPLAFAGAHAAATVASLFVMFGAGMSSGGEGLAFAAGGVLFVLGQPLWWLMMWALDADVLNGEDLFGASTLGLVFIAGAVTNSLLWGWAWGWLGRRKSRAV